MTCERCGYAGMPVYWHGRRVACPICDRDPEFDAEVQRAMGNYRLRIRTRRKPSELELLKAGRNKPCPCGSGLKVKRCHGNGRFERPAA